ncbi:rubredoxin, partial [Bradyrhizobium sp. INPA01-394B]|nr:rubredoxin [Bradyrhizobium campsiandrae]
AKYRCPDCGYIYDETAGHPHEGFLPGTPWSAVPQSWCCPDCAVRDKVDFELIERSPVAAPHSAAMVATRSAPTTAQASPTVVMERPVASAQSGQHQLWGTADHGVPGRKPSCGWPAVSS